MVAELLLAVPPPQLADWTVKKQQPNIEVTPVCFPSCKTDHTHMDFSTQPTSYTMRTDKSSAASIVF